jgi:hypothetical protein
MKTSAKEMAYMAANMTNNAQLQLEICLYDAEIEASTWT